MKDIFLRLRHWIIKKLGGFTEQRTLSHLPIVRTDIQVKKIQAQIMVRPEDLAGSIDYKRYFEQYMGAEIMRKLQGSGEVILESEENAFRGEVILRATLYVVEGPGAALYLHRPQYEEVGWR